ncbi:hypothetical protein [Povalibacter sp.]|uniref:hypothetical protein n=1 Tax=Povalibacter sp. TaxID=1962978 RepID=UPI002F3F9CAA
MSSTQETISSQMHGVASAANADDLGEHLGTTKVTETASGWDAYEVWRRFIKEARDRREAVRIAASVK